VADRAGNFDVDYRGRRGRRGAYIGLMRGAVDVPLAWAAWSGRNGLGARGGFALAVALLAANLVLAAAGLIGNSNRSRRPRAGSSKACTCSGPSHSFPWRPAPDAAPDAGLFVQLT